MSGHKIDAGFLSRLQAARIAAREEVQGSSYYGFDPERRMSSFADSIENGLGGDVGKFLGMLDPDTVSRLVNELAYAMQSLKHVHRLTEHAINFDPEIAPVALPTECVESFGTPESALAKILKCDSAVMIPKPDVKFQVGDQWVGIDDFTEVRNVLGGWLESSVETENMKWRRLTLGGLAREVVERFDEREANLRSGDALVRGQRDTYRSEVEHQKGLVETYREAAETSNEAVKTSSETTKTLLDERTAILGRIIDWENAYQGGVHQLDDLPGRIAGLINAYGALYQGAAEADKAHRGQDELLREVDVLGAYLKYPARETEAETRLEIVKAALTKIEEQDELIGTLQRALVAAQNGQPRRPTGAQGWSEGITENHPIMTWFEKEFVKRLCADLDLDLDKMRRLFDKK